MRFKILFTIMVLFLFFALVPRVQAQDFVNRAEMDQIKKEMAELKSLVKDLKIIIKQQNETIKELQEHSITDKHAPVVTAAEEEHDEQKPAEKHKEKGLDMHEVLASIKPKISVTGDFVANLSDDHHIRTEEDRFDLRGVDIDFIGEIDGVGKAYANIAYHDDDVELEEAYFIAEHLLPFSTDFKFGKFRVNFGLLNTIHPHALPQVDYPLIYRAYLGEEGYVDEGIGIAGEFPSLWGTPFQYSLQALNGNRHEHGEEEGHDHDELYDRLRDYDDIVYVGRLQNKFHLTEKSEVKWGFSGLSGKFEDDEESPRFYYQGADLTLTWHPFKAEHKRIRWQSELISAQIEEGSSWERSYGVYSFLDYQFAPDWLIGARFDYAELPLRSRDHINEYSAYLTHRYTENNRLRVQFKNTHRNHDKDTNEVLLQWVFTLGEHEHLEEEGHDH